jgi:polyvinyl alcohol dehydrogenase (cytochrome)
MSRYALILSACSLVALLASLPAVEKPKGKPTDAHDWTSYNANLLGTRHNAAEKSLGKGNVGKLVEKWRFPPRLSLTFVGAVTGTPVVVNGYVYFGTATLPTVYKLTPNGKVKWSYSPKGAPKKLDEKRDPGLPDSGFVNSCLVTADAVYIADVAGAVYALGRFTGKERWVVNARRAPFPGAHTSNCFFAAPVMVEGQLIVAGGGYEHAYGAMASDKCCTGRGFVAALDPKTGKGIWKYDVGEKPKALKPPVKIKYAGVERTFHFGPSTSSVWSTPSYDATTGLIYFGTDAHNSPRQPTKEDPKPYTRHSCALVAIEAKTGKERWVTQINPGDVWNYGLPAYDTATGLYKDQSVGDTPKPYTITVDGKPTRVVGAGCKNGAFYVLDAKTGKLLFNTPVYKGPPSKTPKRHLRTLALPGAAGGLQTGCATDGKAIYTNGMDMPFLAVSLDPKKRFQPPTGGRVVSISLDTKEEHWRHERPKVKAVGGFKDVGDPVGSGVALANGVAYFTTTVSNKLVAVDTATGKPLKELPLGAVWCGPSVSRGRVYVGTGNIFFAPFDSTEAFFPKSLTGAVYSFGLPGKDEVDRMGSGNE